MIRSRVNAGLARARARGVKLGRPKVSAKVEAAIRDSLAAGTDRQDGGGRQRDGAADQGGAGCLTD